MILSNDVFVAFHYRSYGTFFYNKIGSIISIGDLPTTNIIEPNIDSKKENFRPITKGGYLKFSFICKLLP